jgi:hypothetical protein
MQVPSRVANQRRIVYYATLPEIVRRPNPGVQESPYWTNYLLPRELSGNYTYVYLYNIMVQSSYNHNKYILDTLPLFNKITRDYV